MATHQSAVKRARAAKRRAERNKLWKTRMKNAIKRIRSATDKNTAAQQLRKAVKLLDQLAAKGVIHPNKAANNKSQLTRLVNKLP